MTNVIRNDIMSKATKEQKALLVRLEPYSGAAAEKRTAVYWVLAKEIIIEAVVNNWMDGLNKLINAGRADGKRNETIALLRATVGKSWELVSVDNRYKYKGNNTDAKAAAARRDMLKELVDFEGTEVMYLETLIDNKLFDMSQETIAKADAKKTKYKKVTAIEKYIASSFKAVLAFGGTKAKLIAVVEAALEELRES